MKTVKLLQTTVIGVAAAMMLSACGDDSTDGVITLPTPPVTAEVYTADETIDRALHGVEYLSTFDHTPFLDGTKAGTAVDTTFACDSGSSDVRIAYLDAENSTLILSNFNNCQLNGVLITDDTETLGIIINIEATADSTRSLVYSINPATGVQHLIGAGFNHYDESYRATVGSTKIVGEPFSTTSAFADLFGSLDVGSGTHAVLSGGLGRTESDSTGTTLIYDYTFDYQNANTLYFVSDIIGEPGYEYVIQ
ncbi:MAG: hypothetical protein ABFR02_02195 [Campylobacterota bacterium]